MAFWVGMLLGTIGGGLLGQIHLYIPYLVRAAIVVPLFALAWFRMPELGYTPRALELRRVPGGMRRGFVQGMEYGLRPPGGRPPGGPPPLSLGFIIFRVFNRQRHFLPLPGEKPLWGGG